MTTPPAKKGYLGRAPAALRSVVATEGITLLDSRKIRTLKELLRPGLRAVIVGINPSPVSVSAGHYWQGRHGIRRWALLRKFEITPPLPPGAENDAAFELGYGFCDIVRRPTESSKELTGEELRAADLLSRLTVTGDRSLIVFTYMKARRCADYLLSTNGYRVHQIPSPYASNAESCVIIQELQRLLSIRETIESEIGSALRDREARPGKQDVLFLAQVERAENVSS